MIAHRIRLVLLGVGLAAVIGYLPVALPLWKCERNTRTAMGRATPWFVLDGRYYEFPLGSAAREAPGVFTSHLTHPPYGYSIYFYPGWPFRLHLHLITGLFRLFWVFSLVSIALFAFAPPSRRALLGSAACAVAVGVLVPTAFHFGHYWGSVAGAGDRIPPQWHAYVQPLAILFSLPAMPFAIHLPHRLVDESFMGGIIGTVAFASFVAAAWFTVFVLVPIGSSFLARYRRRA